MKTQRSVAGPTGGRYGVVTATQRAFAPADRACADTRASRPVQVVHHEHDGGRPWVVEGKQVVDLGCPVDPRPSWPGARAAAAGPGVVDLDEDGTGAVAHVLGVLLAVLALDGPDRVPAWASLVGLLI